MISFPLLKPGIVVLVAALLSGCSTPMSLNRQVVAPGEAPVLMGTPVRSNVTPLEGSLACLARKLSAAGQPPLVIGVGDIKDFTGRYSINEGNVVTQGGSLMLFSALGKLGGTVRVAERFDPTIAERELGYMDRRQLGNGQTQEVNGQKVPWLPYYGGTIQATDFYIAGGITEVNYNIASGGAEAALNNIGFKGRTYTQSVAIDMRIVDTRSLMVIDAVSLSKQFTGYEVGANTFRFFGLSLIDVNVGTKAQEPLQLGIRAAIEEATIRLVSRVSGLDSAECLDLRTRKVQPQTSEQQFASQTNAAPALAKAAPVAKPAAKPAGSGGASLNTASPGFSSISDAPTAKSNAEEIIRVAFEPGEAALGGAANALADRIIVAASKGVVQVFIVTRDTESLEPGKRSRLLDQRVSSLLAALTNRGLRREAVNMVWRPTSTDQSKYRDAAGLQVLAKLRITT
jgi:curli biogenesis system outer membrane secretion channel CsgG